MAVAALFWRPVRYETSRFKHAPGQVRYTPNCCDVSLRRSEPPLCLLCLRHSERTLEIQFRFRGISLRRLKCDFTGDPINLGFVPSFIGCFDSSHCFANAAPGVIEFSEVRIGQSQI